MNGANGHNSQNTSGFSGDVPTVFRKPDEVEALVERMLLQCRALLRQQLEHKTRREPLLYNAAGIEHVLRQFDAVSEDIQLVILDRVRARVRTFVQHELERVLRDSTDAAITALEEPVVGPMGYDKPMLAGGGPSWRETPRDDLLMNDRGQGSRNGVVEVPVAPTPSEPYKQPPAAPSPARDDYQGGKTAPRGEANRATPPSGAMKRREERPLPAVTNVADGGPSPLAVAAPVQPADSELVHGKVKLSIAASESIQQVIQFVDALRRRNEFRVVQVVGSHDQGVGIWLVLRIPLALKQVLLGMVGVSQVDGPKQSTCEEDDAPVVSLRLAPVSLN